MIREDTSLPLYQVGRREGNIIRPVILLKSKKAAEQYASDRGLIVKTIRPYNTARQFMNLVVNVFKKRQPDVELYTEIIRDDEKNTLGFIIEKPPAEHYGDIKRILRHVTGKHASISYFPYRNIYGHILPHYKHTENYSSIMWRAKEEKRKKKNY